MISPVCREIMTTAETLRSEARMLSRIMRLETELLQIEMIDCFPRPEKLACWRDVLDAISIHLSIRSFGIRYTTQHTGTFLCAKLLYSRIKQLAIVQMVLIVMRQRIAVFPYDVALWIDLHHDTATILLPEREQPGSIWMDAVVREVSILQKLSMSPWAIRKVPLMYLIVISRQPLPHMHLSQLY
jgi:hypothetical protein